MLTASQEKDIFPLRDSYFENIPVKIPYEYRWLLEEEYGKKSLTLTTFQKYVPLGSLPTWLARLLGCLA